LFQSLLSLALIAFAGLVGFVLLTSVRSSQQVKVPPEASLEPVVTDRAEWKQFYDTVVGSERPADVAQPADAVPEKRAASDVAEVPPAIPMPEDPAPGASIPPTATTTLPVAPDSAPAELAAKPDAPPLQAAAPPDPPHDEKGINAAVSNEPGRDQEPQEAAPSVAASENAVPALATAPVPSPDGNTETSTPTTPLPVARPASAPPATVAAPVLPEPSAAQVKQAAPRPEREPERSRPSIPSRARVALPRQRSAPQSEGRQRNGTQWVDPQQQQPDALSYAPPQYNAMPPGGPQFGPYFPYGSTPPTAQQRRARQSRSPQPAARQPAPTYNDPFGWR
jgi:hypothetical protein